MYTCVLYEHEYNQSLLRVINLIYRMFIVPRSYNLLELIIDRLTNRMTFSFFFNSAMFLNVVEVSINMPEGALWHHTVAEM